MYKEHFVKDGEVYWKIELLIRYILKVKIKKVPL